MPTPRAHLGHEVGADRTLADWGQITGYFSKLAAATPAVRVDTLGRTTSGLPLIVATVIAPEHMRRLEEIRRPQARLADPRKLTAADGSIPPSVLVRRSPRVQLSLERRRRGGDEGAVGD